MDSGSLSLIEEEGTCKFTAQGPHNVSLLTSGQSQRNPATHSGTRSIREARQDASQPRP